MRDHFKWKSWRKGNSGFGHQLAIDWMHDTLAAALPASEIIKPRPGVQFEF